MLKDFQLAARRCEEIQKEAFAALAAKPLAAAARWAVKNPLRAAGAAFAGSEIVAGGKNLAKSVQKTPVAMPGTFNVSPRTF